MIIRDATESDVPAITDILNWAIENSTAIFRAHLATYEERAEFLTSLQSDGFPYLVAEDEDGTHLGWALYKPLGDPAIWLGSVEDTVYIHPDAHGKGVGTALLRAVVDRAKADPEVHTMVARITADNEASLKLHEKVGFTHCGTVRQVTKKFGQWIDLSYLQIMCEDNHEEPRKKA